MVKNSKKPRLRFKGFTDEWEQRKVSDLAYRYDNLRLPITAKDRISGRTPYYGANGIQDYVQGFTHEGEFVLIAEDGANDIKNYPVQYVNGQIWVNNHAHVLQANENNITLFIKYLITSSNIASILVGGGRSKLNSDALMNFEISIPIKQEQQKIAKLFLNLDNLITLHQRKYDKLLNVKKALLDKMFPKNQEKTPKIRFKGFFDAWEQRKLGEIGRVAMNRRIFKEQTSASGEVPFYKIGTFGGEPDAFISDELYQKYKEQFPYPKVGDILLSASGSVGKMVEYKGEKAYFQDSNIVWLEHDTSVSNSFLKCFYAVVKWAGLEGSTIKRLYNKNILETQISLPLYKEQLLIGDLFEQIDNLITLHQRECEKLKNIKKALLDKMFV